MEKKAKELKAMMKKHRPKAEDLDPRKWIKEETLAGFADFISNRHSDREVDTSFDNSVMSKKNDVVAMKALSRGLNANARDLRRVKVDQRDKVGGVSLPASDKLSH
ncbi:hypothetical protein EYF80_015521 [Liparis tanakae]|uniref:Uncharacterized protein n=1 Tax=Liparis tanakae TaxID=230148 RepID=A0A4Z2I8J1_9TELE|nr:hypothetical protein EYF80_015521 [Liparis tanakae]